MTFTSGDSLTPLATLLNQAVTEGKAYTDTQLSVIHWTMFTPTAGGSSTAGVCRYRKFGPMVEIRLAITYQGSGLTAGSDGNLTDTTLFTGAGFPAGILPSQTLYLHAHRYRTAAGLSCGVYMAASGLMVITDMYPTATLVGDDQVFITATWATG